MRIEKLKVQDLHILTELFEYNDVQDMIDKCTYNIENGIIDIFVLYDKDAPVGELRVMYQKDDENFAVRGKRAYLYAFRVREEYQSRGLGKSLMNYVLDILKEQGYSELTIGVEDDNLRALHIYKSLGFNEFVLRKREEYQGDEFEYSLYLKRI